AAEPDDLASIETEILNTRIRLQRDLQTGPAYLRQLSRRGQSIAEVGRPEIVKCLAASVQAQEDVQNCRSGAWVILAIAIFLVNVFLLYVIPVSPHVSSIPKPTDNKLADQFYQTAVELDSAGKTAEAGAAAAEAIAMNPNLAGAQLLMGRI